MIREALAIALHIRRAERKHPNFPDMVARKHTTFRSLQQRMDAVKTQNDSGAETMASVLEEECAELFCDMYKKRWRRAERELFDIIAVCWRIYKFIRARKREQYNRVASYLRYRRMLQHRQLIQGELFPHYGQDPCRFSPFSLENPTNSFMGVMP